MVDPEEMPKARQIYRCRVCYAMHDAEARPPERVHVINPDRDEAALSLICPGCVEILDDQARVDAARQAVRLEDTERDAPA